MHGAKFEFDNKKTKKTNWPCFLPNPLITSKFQFILKNV